MAIVSAFIADFLIAQAAAQTAANRSGQAFLLGQGQHRETTMEDDLFVHLQDWDKNYLLDEVMK